MTEKIEIDLSELDFLPAWAKRSAQDTVPLSESSAETEKSASSAHFQPADKKRFPKNRFQKQKRETFFRKRDKDDTGSFAERFKGKSRRYEKRDQPPLSRQPAAPLEPLPQIKVAFLPDERGIQSLAQQIKLTGRSYPIFDLARVILNKPERYEVQLEVIPKPDGSVEQPLWRCELDGTIWLSETDAIKGLLRIHYDHFYKTERVEREKPVGNYTCVAICGLSGEILGPPNYHAYQKNLRDLYLKRFSRRLPFEAFKAKVKIAHDEETVKKWLEEAAWKTSYLTQDETNPQRFESRPEVENHFRQHHLPTLLKSVSFAVLKSGPTRQNSSPLIRKLIQRELSRQMAHPAQVGIRLMESLGKAGLKIFKLRKVVTHVAVARPTYLDIEVEPVSEGVRHIIDFIRTHPNITRQKLLESLAPSIVAKPITTDETVLKESPSSNPSEQDLAVLADFHWLLHRGHVIEFVTGKLQLPHKPVPKNVPEPPHSATTTENLSTPSSDTSLPENPVEATNTEQSSQPPAI